MAEVTRDKHNAIIQLEGGVKLDDNALHRDLQCWQVAVVTRPLPRQVVLGMRARVCDVWGGRCGICGCLWDGGMCGPNDLFRIMTVSSLTHTGYTHLHEQKQRGSVCRIGLAESMKQMGLLRRCQGSPVLYEPLLDNRLRR